MEGAQNASYAVFELRPVARQEIINTVNSSKGGSAPRCDLIAAKFIKSNIQHFVDPLYHVINQSIRNSEWRIL